MRRTLGLLTAALLVSAPAAAQTGRAAMDVTRETVNVDGSSFSFAAIPPPASATLGCVGVFLGSPLNLQCDAGISYDAATDTLTTETVRATSYAAQPKTVTITGSTNATPIVVTAVGHGLQTNDWISISGITGNTNANGFFLITRLTADTFSLQNYSTGADIAGNGAHGGTPVAVTGIVQANRVLVGDGSAAQPGVAFASDPDTGWYSQADGYNAFATNGTARFSIGVNGFGMMSTGTIYWSSSTIGAAQDLALTRAAAATLQLGAANAASPVAQVLKFQDATGTNANAAATATIKGPAGTGTGTPGAIVFQAAVGGSSGSTAHTQTDALKIIGAASGGVPGVVLAATQSPASNAACTAGTITWNASYIYICTASGAWKRAALTGGY